LAFVLVKVRALSKSINFLVAASVFKLQVHELELCMIGMEREVEQYGQKKEPSLVLEMALIINDDPCLFCYIKDWLPYFRLFKA